MRVLVVVLLATGCGRWGFDTPSPGPDGSAGDDDARIDSLIDTSGPGDCIDTAAAEAEPFETAGIGCGTWGATIMDNTSVARTTNGLELTIQAGAAGAQGGCIHPPSAFTAAGSFLELGTVPPASTSALTGYVIDGAGGSSGKFSMYAESGVLKARDYVSVFLNVPHDPVAMRWLRMRPTTGVEFEVSADGRTWTTLGASPLAPPASVQITIYGGVNLSEATPTVTRFEGVNVCP